MTWEELKIPCGGRPGEFVPVPPGWPLKWAMPIEGGILLRRPRTRYRRFRDWLVRWLS